MEEKLLRAWSREVITLRSWSPDKEAIKKAKGGHARNGVPEEAHGGDVGLVAETACREPLALPVCWSVLF